MSRELIMAKGYWDLTPSIYKLKKELEENLPDFLEFRTISDQCSEGTQIPKHQVIGKEAKLSYVAPVKMNVTGIEVYAGETLLLHQTFPPIRLHKRDSIEWTFTLEHPWDKCQWCEHEDSQLR